MWCGRKGIDCPYSGEFGECHRSACCNTTTEKSMDDIKREAVKEFVEKLKQKYAQSCSEYYPELIVLTSEQLDELSKEYEK